MKTGTALRIAMDLVELAVRHDHKLHERIRELEAEVASWRKRRGDGVSLEDIIVRAERAERHQHGNTDLHCDYCGEASR